MFKWFTSCFSSTSTKAAQKEDEATFCTSFEDGDVVFVTDKDGNKNIAGIIRIDDSEDEQTDVGVLMTKRVDDQLTIAGPIIVTLDQISDIDDTVTDMQIYYVKECLKKFHDDRPYLTYVDVVAGYVDFLLKPSRYYELWNVQFEFTNGLKTNVTWTKDIVENEMYKISQAIAREEQNKTFYLYNDKHYNWLISGETIRTVLATKLKNDDDD